MNFIKKYRDIVGFIGCTIIIVSCFLPFITVSLFDLTETTNFFQRDGKLILAILLITIILIILKKDKISLIPTVSIGFVYIQSICKILKDFKSIENFGYINFKIGFYLIIFGILITLIYPFLPKEKTV